MTLWCVYVSRKRKKSLERSRRRSFYHQSIFKVFKNLQFDFLPFFRVAFYWHNLKLHKIFSARPATGNQQQSFDFWRHHSQYYTAPTPASTVIIKK